MSNFFKELKRRNVIKATVAYLVVAWVLLQVISLLLPIFNAPDWVLRIITLMLAIGLPIWIIISWVYNITPEGFEKTSENSGDEWSSQATNKRLNAFLITSLSIAVIVLTLKVTGVFSSASNDNKAIAVLPFVNMSNDAEQEYFSDGISEEIINMLAQVPNLKVMGRTSSFAFKGKNMDLKRIGEQLKVGYLLEGSVRRSGNILGITAQLINVADGTHLYSEKFDREFEDVFDIQDEISVQILNAIKIKLLGQAEEAVLKKYTDNTAAYDLYLKGRFHLNKFTPEGFIKAIEFYDKAIALDSTYAIAYAEKGFSYMNLGYFRWLPPEEVLPLAFEATNKALELDDNIAESHLTYGRWKFHHEWNVRDAKSSFEKALAINPNSPQAHIQLGFCLIFLNRFEEAREHADIAEKLDPLSILNLWYLSSIYYFTKDYQRDLEIANKIIDLEGQGFDIAAEAYLGLKKYEEALALANTMDSINPGAGGWIQSEVFAKQGDNSKAFEEIELLKTRDEIRNALRIAELYNVVGDLDNAFKYYTIAVENREDLGSPWYIIYGLHSDALKGDPRLEPLIEKMNIIY